MGFYQKLSESWRKQRSLLCVGLDPDAEKLPRSLKTGDHPLFAFNRAIIDATAGFCCAFKLQIACYSAYRAERQLEKTIDYIKTRYPRIPVILDAKRGDIDATARMYAREAFMRYNADAVTVNPYMGGDALAPFLCFTERGVIVLCKTSNAGSGDLQDLMVAGEEVYTRVARLAVNSWNANNNVALVVGATYPKIMGRIRRMVGNMPLLVPGVGTQGGSLESALANGLTADKDGLLINVSRAIIHADSGGWDFAVAAAEQAEKLNLKINQLRACHQTGIAE